MTIKPSVAARMFESVERDNLSMLMIDLYDDRNAAARDARGRTLLIAACERPENRHQMVEQLLTDGVPAHARDERGRNALLAMAEAARPEERRVLDQLLAANLNISERDHAGRTALHGFARVGWVEGCEKLFAVAHNPGALCNARDDQGRTPLMEAIEHPALAFILLSYRADPRIKDLQGNTAIDMAADKPALQAAFRAKAAKMDADDALIAEAAQRSNDELLECVSAARDFLQTLEQPKKAPRPS